MHTETFTPELYSYHKQPGNKLDQSKSEFSPSPQGSSLSTSMSLQSSSLGQVPSFTVTSVVSTLLYLIEPCSKKLFIILISDSYYVLNKFKPCKPTFTDAIK